MKIGPIVIKLARTEQNDRLEQNNRAQKLIDVMVENTRLKRTIREYGLKEALKEKNGS